jgi:UDP-N-acetylglucosamine--N-acetylmuramyl-(pentapeptide) pyrophosphoryl-undecaprenol N-acetylglucosamine transferase
VKAPRSTRVALAGGGSGGHLFPGLAVARAIQRDGGRPVLYGSTKAGEAGWVGTDAERVPLDSPLLPKDRREVPRFLLRLAGAVERSIRDLRARRPDLVVGLGGYASVAPGIAALLLGKPLLLLEQNVVPGKANRLLSLLGGRMAASFPESIRRLPAPSRRRARVLGNPVRPSVMEGRRDPAAFGLSPDSPILLVMGGSQGAAGVNDAVAEAAGVLARRGVQALHLSGPRDEESLRAAYREAGAAACVKAFQEDMGTAYATADLILCRSGGTTLAELTARARPSVLVPYPHHRDHHQEMNARVLADAGAARIVPEADLDPERFEREVVDLIVDRESLSAMERAAASLGVPDAADRVARWAADLIARGGGA